MWNLGFVYCLVCFPISLKVTDYNGPLTLGLNIPGPDCSSTYTKDGAWAAWDWTLNANKPVFISHGLDVKKKFTWPNEMIKIITKF